MRIKPPPPRVAAAPEAAPTNPAKLIRIGRPDGAGTYRFHIEADLDPRGAGVRRLTLNKFQAADRGGRPVWKDKENREPEPLELLPEEANREITAYALYHYDPRDTLSEHPLDTLGKVVWNVVGDPQKPVAEDTEADGRVRQRVSFQTEIDDVVITKTFSLTEGDYHIGLEIRLNKKANLTDSVDRPFRYQLAGGRGIPLEGEWYTTTFRNALIARVERGNVYRDLRISARSISGAVATKSLAKKTN